ncbi:hypothetical protein FRZ06_10025 [Anoxybacterium hadale]|uniref:Uncharacterized protein n=1 Tax=Anoxybacterium hadale TaxID=3408580 RepID=A0ACD1ABG4_9FIRM|nr:hypothetical protein FRZ06_10025 [Clostridiales bacterium]
MLYKDHEIDISTTNYTAGVAIIPLPDGSIVCIPEEGATVEELELIQRIRDDVESRPAPEPIDVAPEPTTEEYLVDLDFRLSMIELGL